MNGPGLFSVCLSGLSFALAVGLIVWPFVEEFRDLRTLGSALFVSSVGLVAALLVESGAAYVAKLADQPRAAKVARLAFKGLVGAVGLLGLFFVAAIFFS